MKKLISLIVLLGYLVPFTAIAFDYTSREEAFEIVKKHFAGRDEDGNIVGGEAFIIEMPELCAEPLNITMDDSDDETVKLSVDNNNARHIAWFNDDNQLIAEGSSVELPKTAAAQHISVSAFNAAGEMATESVTLESYIGIKDILVDSNNATVKLKSKASASAELTLSSVNDASVFSNAAVKAGDRAATFNVSNLRRNAVYVITYRENGEYVDSQKFTLE